jgi:hypothetical protein
LAVGILFEPKLKKAMIDIDKLEADIVKTIQKEEGGIIMQDSYEQKLQEQFLQPQLKYVKEKSNKIAGSEIISDKNKQDATSTIQQNELSYIEFQFAIEGNYMHKDIVFDRVFLEENNLHFDTVNTNVFLIYKTYTNLPANGGGDTFLEKTNEEGIAKRTLIELRAEVFNQEVEQVNIRLKAFIHNSLEDARTERKEKKESLSQLDPF